MKIHFQDQQPETKLTRLQKFFGLNKKGDKEAGSIDFSIAGLFRCMLCTHKNDGSEQAHLVHIADQLAELNNKIRDLELKLSGNITVMREEDDIISSHSGPTQVQPEESSIESEPDKSINLLPDWIYDPEIRNGDTKTLPVAEEVFWKDLIEKYLKPIDMTDKEKKDVQVILMGLRDMCVFAFMMFNAFFVLIILLFQLNKEQLHVDWPWGGTDYITYDEGIGEITIRREYLELEPIGLMFVGFFGLILLIQFIAMIIHRFATISQILASTTLEWYCGKKAKEMSAEADLRGAAVDIARRLQRPKAQWDEDDLDENQQNIAKRRDTIKKNMYSLGNKQDWSNLETNFKRRYLAKDLDLGRFTIKRKATHTLLESRRTTLIEKRKSVAEQRQLRKSQIQAGGVPQPQSFTTARSSIINYKPMQHTSYENTAIEIEDDMEDMSPGPRKSVMQPRAIIMQPHSTVMPPRNSILQRKSINQTRKSARPSVAFSPV